MKRTAKIITALFLALSLLLPYAVFAESGGIMEGIYEKLMAEDSEFTEQARLFDTYYDGASLRAALEGDSIVISLDAGEGNEYMESGSWTFTRDGDYLTTTIGGYDYYGASMLLMVLFAAGRYWEYDTSLLNSYLSGAEVLGVETPDYSCEIDSQTGDRTIRVYIAGKMEMKELDSMVLTREVLTGSFYMNPLREETVSRIISLGKVILRSEGSKSNLTMLAAEYGALDDVALKDILAALEVLQPDGWEEFTSSYTALEDAETDTYSVRLNVSREEAEAISPTMPEGWSYMLVHFGKAE